MDILTLIPNAIKLLKKRKAAINVTTIDNVITVSIIKRFSIKRFVVPS